MLWLRWGTQRREGPVWPGWRWVGSSRAIQGEILCDSVSWGSRIAWFLEAEPREGVGSWGNLENLRRTQLEWQGAFSRSIFVLWL